MYSIGIYSFDRRTYFLLNQFVCVDQCGMRKAFFTLASLIIICYYSGLLQYFQNIQLQSNATICYTIMNPYNKFLCIAQSLFSLTDFLIKIYQSIRKTRIQMFLQIQNFLFLLLFILSKTNMAFVFKPSWQNQGVGARVIRVIGNQKLKNLDPFLMLDYFHVKLPAGFPDHPHRGFETVTYMKQGYMYHQDFKGHSGKIGPGDIQWMTAGKGVVHSQIPGSKEEASIGFQLWINLKSDMKMIEPAYQQYTSDKLPIIKKQQAQIKVICGSWEGQKGPIKDRTPSIYFDIKLKQNGTFSIPVPKKWNSIAFVYDGQVIYQGSKKVQNQHCLVMEKSQQKQIIHTFKTEKGASFLLIGGQPIGEKVVQHGPFVMNTQQQIMETFKDYQYGKNGFQHAGQWESKIKDLTKGKKIEQL